jgi:hypothetical protein
MLNDRAHVRQTRGRIGGQPLTKGVRNSSNRPRQTLWRRLSRRSQVGIGLHAPENKHKLPIGSADFLRRRAIVTSGQQTSAAHVVPSPATQGATLCNLRQHSQQKSLKRSVGAPLPQYNSKWFCLRESWQPMENAENGLNAMKTNEIREIRFLREKSVDPHLPQPSRSPCTCHPKTDPPQAKAFFFNKYLASFGRFSVPPQCTNLHNPAQIAQRAHPTSPHPQPPSTSALRAPPPCILPKYSSPS